MRVVNRHTLSVPRPYWWDGDWEADTVDLDDRLLLRLWYDHVDLGEIGVTIIEITENRRRLERGEVPGEIRCPMTFPATYP